MSFQTSYLINLYVAAISQVSGNTININDFSNEDAEANKKHDVRDSSSRATPQSLTPSHCRFYELFTFKRCSLCK